MRRVVVAALLGTLPAVACAQTMSQPTVVCDLTPVLNGAIEEDRLRTYDLVRELAEPVRITFTAMDPKTGTARMVVGEGASGVQEVALTTERGAMSFLAEKVGASKTLVTIQTKAPSSPKGWPAILSQHGWIGGDVTIRAMSGACRLRAG